MNIEKDNVFSEEDNDIESFTEIEENPVEIDDIPPNKKIIISNLMQTTYKDYSDKERKMILNALNIANSEKKMKEFCKEMNEKID